MTINDKEENISPFLAILSADKSANKNEQNQMSDAVNHPAHYGGVDNPYEAIKVIDAWGLNFCLGNTVKYISRAGKKGDTLEDLKKARWYLEHEISAQEKLLG